MSYSRSYTISVPYSYSYPASESGGRGSGQAYATIIINVDTTYFDASVVQCGHEVNNLTAAVVATEHAQVESKRQASRKIAKSIVKGFFDYVGADLSQKVKELSSQCEAMFGALLGHKDNCLSKRDQMQTDYNRINKRYAKIFEDLDKEAVSRIQMLDKSVFQFVTTAQTMLDKSSTNEQLGLSTVAADENLKLETVLSCSRIKQQARTVMGKANDYLLGTYRLTHSVEHMLEDGNEEEDIMLPVMYVESAASASGMNKKIYGTGARFTPSGNGMNADLSARFAAQDICWKDMEQDDFDKVVSYFNSDIQSSGMDDRTIKTMLGLLNGQAIQTIK